MQDVCRIEEWVYTIQKMSELCSINELILVEKWIHLKQSDFFIVVRRDAQEHAVFSGPRALAMAGLPREAGKLFGLQHNHTKNTVMMNLLCSLLT